MDFFEGYIYGVTSSYPVNNEFKNNIFLQYLQKIAHLFTKICIEKSHV